jgi:hypothetical protein
MLSTTFTHNAFTIEVSEDRVAVVCTGTNAGLTLHTTAVNEQIEPLIEALKMAKQIAQRLNQVAIQNKISIEELKTATTPKP